MEIMEMSNLFDVLYNNITSNQAVGLNEFEKSVFLTKAQDELVKNYFLPEGNLHQKGFDDSQKRQIDFSMLMMSVSKVKSTLSSTIDPRAYVYLLPNDVMYIINESLQWRSSLEFTPASLNDEGTPVPIIDTAGDKDTGGVVGGDITPGGTFEPEEKPEGPGGNQFEGDIDDVETAKGDVKAIRQVIPLSYDEYTRLMSKPFKEPNKYQAWRLISGKVISGDTASGDSDITKVEIVTTSYDKKVFAKCSPSYVLRYVRRPQPIILVDLTSVFGEGLAIHGQTQESNCELDPSIHEEIVQRAVELAKAAWTGDLNSSVEIGKRSE